MPCQDRAKEPQNSVGNTTSTDSSKYIPNSYRKGYPPKIFTDPKYSVAQTDTDNDSETDHPHIPFLGDYCWTCISKWCRCTCKPPSDWGADLIDITQPYSHANNNKGNGHPPPSDWSNQENGWSGKTYGKTRASSLKPVQVPQTKRDSQESDYNENLYPHQYWAKVQSQAPPRQPPPPGWGKLEQKSNATSLEENNKDDKIIR